MALPDFFIAGAPKAGTTAVHAALARHPVALHVGGQGAQVLPHRRPAADPGRPGRRADLPRARVAAGRLRGAVRPGAGRDPARRVDAVLPLRPGRAAPDPRADPGRQADRDPARPGGAGAFELDPPVVGGPGPGRATSSWPAPRRSAGSRPAGRTSGTTRRSGATGSSWSTCTRCSPGSRSWCSATVP